VKLEAVIFDMDGLMLDTEPLYKLAWQRAAVECGHPISEELYVELIGRSRVDGERILSQTFGADFPVEEFRAACATCEAAAFAENLPALKPGLQGLLDLVESLRLPKAVATSTERHIAERQLRGLGLLPKFDAVATGDEVINGKPAPDLFLLAAERLGVVPSRCLVLEDSEAGVLAAHRAGMLVFCVPDIKQPSAEIEALADGKFGSLMDVQAGLERILGVRLNYGR